MDLEPGPLGYRMSMPSPFLCAQLRSSLEVVLIKIKTKLNINYMYMII